VTSGISPPRIASHGFEIHVICSHAGQMLTAQECESIPPTMIITPHHLDETDSIGQNLPLLTIAQHALNVSAGWVNIQHHITEWSFIGHISEHLQYFLPFRGKRL